MTLSNRAASLFDIRGKRALVTGASRGIGLMIAEGLLEAGAEVAIASRKAGDLAQAAASLKQAGECRVISADVSTAAGARALAEEVGSSWDQLHLLVNNAGVTWGAPIADYPEAGFNKVLNTNVGGPFFLSQTLLPLLRAAGSAEDPARIVNVGSVDGLRPPRFESYAYSASKAAVHMLTRHMAKRLASEQITVNAIAPGPFETRMIAFALGSPADRSALEARIPLARIGQADDIVGAVVFLTSRAGAYLTGTVIPVDGGISACS